MSRFYILKFLGNNISDLLSIPLRAHLFISKHTYRNKQNTPIKKILIIKLWGIGNIVLLLPILKKINEQHGNADIYFLTLESNRGLLENSPYIADVLYFTTNPLRIPIDFFRYMALSKRLNIDLLLNFEQCNKLSIIFSYLTGSKTRTGFEIAGCSYNLLYTDTAKNNAGRHVSENFMELGRKAGIYIDRYKYIPPYIDPTYKEKVKKILKEYGLGDKKIVVLHAGCGENFKGKRWGKENFAILADRLADTYDIDIVYTGVKNENELIADIASKMRHKALNLCDKFTLKELTEFLKYCLLFISNDTGPLHIAISVGINTVGLYGPMNPLQYGSLNNNSLSFYKPMRCSPCLTDLNNKTSFCKKSICLDKISPEEVFEKISTSFFNKNKDF